MGVEDWVAVGPTELGKRLGVSRQRAHQILQKEKHRARRKLNTGVREGRVKKPARCQICGRAGRIEAHHGDYTKPFYVIWLCPKCHSTVHPHYRAPNLRCCIYCGAIIRMKSLLWEKGYCAKCRKRHLYGLRTCARCRKDFVPKQKPTKPLPATFCSDACRLARFQPPY